MSFKKFIGRKVSPKSNDADKRLDKVELFNNLDDVLLMLVVWFGGGFMGGQKASLIPTAMEMFKDVGEAYNLEAPNKFYRTTHIKLPDSVESKTDLLKVTKLKVGLTELTAWSKKPDGALWYFDRFAVRQNGARPVPGRAWVLVSSTQPKPLLDARCAMQFMSDCYHTGRGVVDPITKDTLKHKLGLFNTKEMEDQTEIICKCPKEAPVSVEKIMIWGST